MQSPSGARATIVVLAGLVALTFALVVDAPRRGFPVPAPGEVVADHLDDGTPVFLMNDDLGLRVVDAISGHIEGELVAWCPSSRSFFEPAHGSRFDPRGDWIGGPSPRGLVTWDFVVAEDRIVVQGPVAPLERGTRPFIELAGPDCPEIFAGDPLSPETISHDPDAVRRATGSPESTLVHAWYGEVDLFAWPRSE